MPVPVATRQRGTGSPWRRGMASLALAAGLAGAGLSATARAAEAPTTAPAASPSVCAELAQGDLPKLPRARRALLELLEEHVLHCSGDARYLALLGGLWLEEGNAAQALLWLERALLLDPGLPAARADHALALAGLGELEALQQLRRDWASRSDLPPGLRQRLALADRGLAISAEAAAAWGRPAAREGSPRPPGPRWNHRAELSLLYGHESNLDRSPTLDSLTLTPPGSPPVELPLIEPLRPIPGMAWMPEAAWRSAWDSGAGTLLQAAASVTARRASSQPQTDWHFSQLTLDAWRQWGSWRVQGLVQGARSGGELNEAYTLRRLGLAAETDRGACTWRLALDEEQRRQSLSTYADAHIRLASLGLDCEGPGHPRARWSLVARGGNDHAPDPSRPGGDQRLASLMTRYITPIGRWQLQATLRVQVTHDAEGYSPLLDDNNPRHSRQWIGGLEFTRPLPGLAWGGGTAQGVLQWQRSLLSSNIVVFEHQSQALYGGIRLQW